MDRPVTLAKCTIGSLNPDMTNAIVVGIIIAKQAPRKIAKGNDGRERAVWNLTLRDSPQDYINVACWGRKEDVFLLNEKFQIGDVVEVVRPRIEIRKVGDFGEQFRPMVTSPFTLIVSEQSSVLNHENNDNSYQRLLHLPTKPLAKFVALADVHRKGSTETGASGLDLLGAVRSVGNIRTIKMKDDREEQVRDVVIFDQTNSGLRFTVWGAELNLRANMWKPRETILFMTDMRAAWSNFSRSTVAIITSRTIITEDPVGIEAFSLRKFAQTAPLQTDAILEALETSIPDPNTIKNIMNIKQIKEKLNTLPLNTDSQVQALVYAIVTLFDLDDDSRVFRSKCAHCNSVITRSMNTCEDLECPVGSGQQCLEPLKTMDIRVSVSDHTGTLDNCRLSGKAAEQTLQCDIKTFVCKTSEEKTNLKWRFLMERFAVRVVVLPLYGGRQTVCILHMAPVSPFEVSTKVPHY